MVRNLFESLEDLVPHKDFSTQSLKAVLPDKEISKQSYGQLRELGYGEWDELLISFIQSQNDSAFAKDSHGSDIAQELIDYNELENSHDEVQDYLNSVQIVTVGDGESMNYIVYDGDYYFLRSTKKWETEQFKTIEDLVKYLSKE